MKTSDIRGIIPPVITPMNNDPEQTVNHEALRQQVERLLAGGVHGMFPLGTNGEAYALSFKEKEEVLATVIDQVKGRVPIYAGTGCITTAETIRMSRRAEEMGADALSIITPSFALASQKELYDHYVAVAKQVNIPIILYNIPPRTGNKLLPETVQALCRDVDVIVGAKDSSGDIENLKAYIRLTRELDKDVAILAGNDGAILTCLKEGGAGGIAGRANIWPATVAKIYDCFKAGDLEGAQAAQDAIAFLQHYLQGYPYNGHPQIRAIMTGTDMEMAFRLFTSTGGYKKSLFMLDTSFEHFHYLPNTPEGEVLLKLLVHPEIMEKLDNLLLSDLGCRSDSIPLEHDATDASGNPILLAYDFDMQRINRFNTGLNVYGRSGNLICFDFQIPVLKKYLSATIHFSSIDLCKFKRGFLHEP